VTWTYDNEWKDHKTSATAEPERSYTLSDVQLASLKSTVASTGNLMLGIDTDCHYQNTGVRLKITTQVPEPGTLSLLCLGLGCLVGLAGIRRKKSL